VNALAYTLTLDNGQFSSAINAADNQTKKFTTTAAHVGEQMHKASGHSHELKAGIHLVGGEMLGLGGLGHFIFNPWFLAAAVVVGVIHKLNEALSETGQRIAALQSAEEILSFDKSMAPIKAMSQTLDSIMTFRRQLEHSDDGKDRESEDMRNRISLHNQYMDAWKGLVGTKSEAADVEVEKTQFQIEQEKQRLALAQKQLPLQRAAAEALDRQQAGPARNDIEKQKAELEDRTKTLSKAREELDKRRAGDLTYSGFTSKKLGLNRFLDGMTGNESAEEIKARLPELEKDILQRQYALSVAEQELKNIEAQIEALKKQAMASKGVIDNSKQIAQLQKELEIKQFIANNTGDAGKLFGATSLEKMGLVFNSGGPSMLVDHARATAQNTAEIATILRNQKPPQPQPLTNAPR
jgi:hypothetical protein